MKSTLKITSLTLSFSKNPCVRKFVISSVVYSYHSLLFLISYSSLIDTYSSRENRLIGQRIKYLFDLQQFLLDGIGRVEDGELNMGVGLRGGR